MSVDEPNVVDITAIDHDNGETLLVISDHLPWRIDDPALLYSEGDHLRMLQAKIYRYVDFIASGELLGKVTTSAGTKSVILIKFLYPLSANATNLVNNLRQHIASMGIDLRWEVYDPKGSGITSSPVD